MGVDILLRPDCENLADDRIHIALDTGRHKRRFNERIEILRLDPLLDHVHDLHIGLCQCINRVLIALTRCLIELPLLRLPAPDRLRILLRLLDRKQNLALCRKSGKKRLPRADRHVHLRDFPKLQRICHIENQRDARAVIIEHPRKGLVLSMPLNRALLGQRPVIASHVRKIVVPPERAVAVSRADHSNAYTRRNLQLVLLDHLIPGRSNKAGSVLFIDCPPEKNLDLILVC